MPRIDNPALYDPFMWRLEELDAPDTSPERRRELAAELVAWEAEELAHGYRHVTVRHGDPTDVQASRRVSAFYATVRDVAGGDPWARVRGTSDRVLVSLGGADAETMIHALVGSAERTGEGVWDVTVGVAP